MLFSHRNDNGIPLAHYDAAGDAFGNAHGDMSARVFGKMFGFDFCS